VLNPSPKFYIWLSTSSTAETVVPLSLRQMPIFADVHVLCNSVRSAKEVLDDWVPPEKVEVGTVKEVQGEIYKLRKVGNLHAHIADLHAIAVDFPISTDLGMMYQVGGKPATAVQIDTDLLLNYVKSLPQASVPETSDHALVEITKKVLAEKRANHAEFKKRMDGSKPLAALELAWIVEEVLTKWDGWHQQAGVIPHPGLEFWLQSVRKFKADRVKKISEHAAKTIIVPKDKDEDEDE